MKGPGTPSVDDRTMITLRSINYSIVTLEYTHIESYIIHKIEMVGQAI